MRYKKNGDPKVAMRGIDKGILKDGQNLRFRDEIIEVGGKGKPSVNGVKSFVMDLSEYLGVEIAGYSYSSNSSGKETDMILGGYDKNENKKSFSSIKGIEKKYGENYSHSNFLEHFHTHPWGILRATESAPEMSTDVQVMNSDKNFLINCNYIILYRVLGQTATQEYNYSHFFQPKK